MTSIRIELPIHECMHPPSEPDAEGKRDVGHFHMIMQSGKISQNGEELGEIGFDPSCTLVVKVAGVGYHINGSDLWEAISKALPKRPE